MNTLHMNPIHEFIYKGDTNFWPKELSALAGETKKPRAMPAASQVGGIALTDMRSLAFLPRSRDPASVLLSGSSVLSRSSGLLAGLLSHGGS